MSQSNNPFDQNPNAPNYGGSQAPYAGGAAYGGGPGNQPPKKSALPWILGILGILGVLMLVCCGGMVFMGYRAKDAIGNLAGEQIRMQVEDTLNADPNFSSNIGTIQTFSMDIMATGEANQGNQGAQGQNTWMVFNVTGSSGSGILKLKTGQSQNDFTEAVLVLPDGQELPVDLGSAGFETAPTLETIENNESFLPAEDGSLQLDPQ